MLSCISLDAKRADYQALMAEILTNSGRHREAMARYDRPQDPWQLRGCHCRQAETYLRMGKPDKALKFMVASTPL